MVTTAARTRGGWLLCLAPVPIFFSFPCHYWGAGRAFEEKMQEGSRFADLSTIHRFFPKGLGDFSLWNNVLMQCRVGSILHNRSDFKWQWIVMRKL
jgi:hypothetical protein